MSARDRRSSAGGHILIGGTGRAGTTLLVQYFTALGFDTGFTMEQALAKVDPIANAGLEQSVGRTLASGRPMSYVAKSPFFGDNLAEYLTRGELAVRWCVVPVRELADAAESRRSVTRKAVDAGAAPDERLPGGVLRPKRGGKRQEETLAVKFHRLVHTMVSFDVPILFLRFPDFAAGRQDVYQALEPLLAEHGVTRQESADAFAAVSRPELITHFERSDQQ